MQIRVGFVEWPDGLDTSGSVWEKIASEVAEASLDLLITNELPFGNWIVANSDFDTDLAQTIVDNHENGVSVLGKLSVPNIITSRPIWSGKKLMNEAILIENASLGSIHRKQYFPAEPGWYESSWFKPGDDAFPIVDVGGIKVGVLLCTELMFNERARKMAREGATLIVVPRATGASDMWRVAGQMAAIVGGCYVVSANRAAAHGLKDSPFTGDGSPMVQTELCWHRPVDLCNFV